MPVVELELKRLRRLVGADTKRILDRLPYVGLDIESSDEESVRVEYSPNRPDFGTDYGIARALRGLLGKELGLPSFRLTPSGITVAVDRRLARVRPFIACAAARGLRMDDEDVRQLVSLQEDLHNGVGRRRRRVAIGLHDANAIAPPISYKAVSSAFSFTPLDKRRALSLRQILESTDQGRLYGGVFRESRLYPIITDSRGVVLSFPPVINGAATKVSPKTKDIFMDVTSTDRRSGEDVLAILTTTLVEMGAKLESVIVHYQSSKRVTPDLGVVRMPLDLSLVEEVTGLGLSRKEVVRCLKRSRLGVSGNRVLVPRYRVDLLHPVDLAEEVALGYGFDRIGPIYPPSRQPGSFNPFEQFLDKTADLMAGSGMIELMTYELLDEPSLYGNFRRSSGTKVAVENPRSAEHSLLRDSLAPSLMAALSSNVKEDYPQRVFEIGRVYRRSGAGVGEEWHLGCFIAHSQTSYTEAKMHMESIIRLLAGREASTKQTSNWAFADGRTGTVFLGRTNVGVVGEVAPEAISAFGVGVPVSGFEIDLTAIYKGLK